MVLMASLEVALHFLFTFWIWNSVTCKEVQGNVVLLWTSLLVPITVW